MRCEIRRRIGAEIETPKALRGAEWGVGTKRSGERRELPKRGQGRSSCFGAF